MTPKIIFKTITLVGILVSELIYTQINPMNNIIGVDVSTLPENPSFNYDSCFVLGQNIGMGTVGMYLNWTAIETSPLTYDFTLLDIANIYYPAQGMPVDLTIAPIHTNNLEVPSDLATVAFNNPVMINRFKALLDSIKSHAPNLVLSSLVIGSEHDVYLGTNTTLWAQYTTFYDSVSAYAKVLWPGLKVATEITFNGIVAFNNLVQTLNTNSDYIGVSYYPLNSNFTVKPISTIPIDFATLVGLYPSKPICFYQYGYPSSSMCNSSEELQAQFITQTFKTWDIFASNVKMIDFTWLHDLDSATVNFYGAYYGITDTVFLDFLRTLGLRVWNGNGSNKLAYTELLCQAKQRGYNNFNINCTTEITSQIDNENKLITTVYPNPTKNNLNINVSFDLINAEIIIYNLLGQVQSRISNLNNRNINVETINLANGIYFILLRNKDRQITEKFIISK